MRISDADELVPQCALASREIRMLRLGIGLLAQRDLVNRLLSMPVIPGKRLPGCRGVVLRDGGSDRLKSGTGESERGEKLVVSQRGGAGGQDEGKQTTG